MSWFIISFSQPKWSLKVELIAIGSSLKWLFLKGADEDSVFNGRVLILALFLYLWSTVPAQGTLNISLLKKSDKDEDNIV